MRDCQGSPSQTFNNSYMQLQLSQLGIHTSSFAPGDKNMKDLLARHAFEGALNSS